MSQMKTLGLPKDRTLNRYDLKLLWRTIWFIFDIYEKIQNRKLSEITIPWRFGIRIVWFTLSNAFEKSPDLKTFSLKLFEIPTLNA